jgi:hypothetical protein
MTSGSEVTNTIPLLFSPRFLTVTQKSSLVFGFRGSVPSFVSTRRKRTKHGCTNSQVLPASTGSRCARMRGPVAASELVADATTASAIAYLRGSRAGGRGGVCTMNDLFVLLGRQVQFIRKQEGYRLFMALPALVDFVQREPRLRCLADSVLREFEEAVEGYRDADKRCTAEVLSLFETNAAWIGPIYAKIAGKGGDDVLASPRSRLRECVSRSGFHDGAPLEFRKAGRALPSGTNPAPVTVPTTGMPSTIQAWPRPPHSSPVSARLDRHQSQCTDGTAPIGRRHRPGSGKRMTIAAIPTAGITAERTVVHHGTLRTWNRYRVTVHACGRLHG